jgi:hypothetical protein
VRHATITGRIKITEVGGRGNFRTEIRFVSERHTKYFQEICSWSLFVDIREAGFSFLVSVKAK